MSNKEPTIRIPVDLNNPGQFFACCGLLELADRLWPGAEGWFEKADQFTIRNERLGPIALDQLCSKITKGDFTCLLPPEDRASLAELTERKAALNRQKKSLPKEEEKERKRLNSKRIVSGFTLGSPFDIRIDWWLVENCDGDHLKTWAGQQAIASIGKAIHESLSLVRSDRLFDREALVMRDGEAVAPLSFESGAPAQRRTSVIPRTRSVSRLVCCVWTEFLTLIALQRFALQPDLQAFFTFHAWREPLPPSVAALAAKGQFPQLVGCQGRFRLAGRDSGNRYKAFQQATLTEWRY